jgi:putative effector of murein hydrolase
MQRGTGRHNAPSAVSPSDEQPRAEAAQVRPAARRFPPLATHLLVAAPVLVALVVVLVGGYVLHWSWTGYRGEEGTRKLWDWLEVSLLPLTLALTPVWLHSRTRHPHRWMVAESLAVAALVVLVIGGYLLRWTWTGFTGNTLWDWLGLFLVPFMLPLVFHLLGQQDRRTSGGEPGSVSGPSAARSTPAHGGRVQLAAAAGVVVAVVCVVILAAQLTKDGSSQVGAAGGQGSGATTTATSVVRSLTVDSRDPRWTDTGVAVSVGERVEIAGFGMVLASRRPGYRYVPPTGLTPPRPGQQSLTSRVNHAALVATVGDAAGPSPLDGTDPSKVIAVGEHRILTIRSNGELFLGVNDRKTSDNTGWFGASLTVYRRR